MLFSFQSLSKSNLLQDLKPTRLLCLTKLLKNFIDEFFHLNPISQMGLIVTRNKRAELISELAGNARQVCLSCNSLKRVNIIGKADVIFKD